MNRAKRFQEAIDSGMHIKSPVSMYILGADCKPTLDGVVIVRDEKKAGWRTILSADGFKRSDGTKVSGKDLEGVLYALGDGVVTQRSLLTSSLPGARMQGEYKAALPIAEASFACATHNVLLSNAEVLNKLFADLISKQLAVKSPPPAR